MRTIKIDKTLEVSEIQGPMADWMTDDIEWTAMPVGLEHDVFVNDNAIFEPGLATVNLGAHPKVPLPAYIVGADGEESVDATFTLEEVKAMLH